MKIKPNKETKSPVKRELEQEYNETIQEFFTISELLVPSKHLLFCLPFSNLSLTYLLSQLKNGCAAKKPTSSSIPFQRHVSKKQRNQLPRSLPPSPT